MMRIILSALLSFFMMNLYADTSTGTPRTIEVKLYMSSECPHCHKADIYLTALTKQYSWLKLKHYIINKDLAALDSFNEHLKKHGQHDFSVPSLFFCGQRWVGFDEKDKTKLNKALEDCARHHS